MQDDAHLWEYLFKDCEIIVYRSTSWTLFSKDTKVMLHIVRHGAIGDDHNSCIPLG